MDERIEWYRSSIPKERLKELTCRSDAKGLLQAGGFLAVLCTTAGLAIWSVGRLPWPAVVALVYLHGMVNAFNVNAMHELNHGTVFKTRALNLFFLKIVSFLGWINYPMFHDSHVKHHQFTLHPPRDQEELPESVPTVGFILRTAFDPVSLIVQIKNTIRHAAGKVNRPWEEQVFPTPESRRPIKQWARILLAGHGLILAVSIWMGWWIVPVVISMPQAWGRTVQLLCNKTQHAGLPGHVNDWRVIARSIRLNPVLGFLYWNMHYHIEHHMYAAVPCYHLKALRREIEDDLPLRNGLVKTWIDIFKGTP